MRLTAILDKTQRVIRRGDARMVDLARFLGKNWNQCHEWIVKRNHLPSAEVALGMMHFVALNDSNGERNITYKKTDKGIESISINGKPMSDSEHELLVENNLLKTMLASPINAKN